MIVTLTANVAHSHSLSRLQMIVMIETARVAGTVLVVARVGLIRGVRRIVVITAAHLIHVVLVVRRIVRLIGVLSLRLFFIIIFRQKFAFRIRYLVAAEDTAKRIDSISETFY